MGSAMTDSHHNAEGEAVLDRRSMLRRSIAGIFAVIAVAIGLGHVETASAATKKVRKPSKRELKEAE